jgi:hypothetical protein
MRMIPANILANIIGAGFDVDPTNFYNSVALDFKCMGYWKFEETTAYSGQDFEVKDSSPAGVHGRMSAVNATHDTANSQVELRNAGHIDFGNNYDMNFIEPFSISLKVNMLGVSGQNVNILSKMTTVGGVRGWYMYFSTDERYIFTVRGSTLFYGTTAAQKQVTVQSASGMSTGVSRHVMVTYTGPSAGGLNLYVNGERNHPIRTATTQGETPWDAMRNPAHMLLSGTPWSGTTALPPKVVEHLGIWTRALSSAEVRSHYNTGTTIHPVFRQNPPDVAFMAHLIRMELTADHTFTNADVDIRWNEGLTISEETYVSRQFEVSNVEYSASPTVDKITVDFDNVDLHFSQLVLAEEVRGKIMIVHQASINRNYEVTGRTFEFWGVIDSVEITETKARFNVFSHMYLWQKKVPKRRHSSRCPWTFKDSGTCKYAGGDSNCDKSWDDCSAKANTVNFGGFRWVPSLVDQRIWWGSVPNDGDPYN